MVFLGNHEFEAFGIFSLNRRKRLPCILKPNHHQIITMGFLCAHVINLNLLNRSGKRMTNTPILLPKSLIKALKGCLKRLEGRRPLHCPIPLVRPLIKTESNWTPNRILQEIHHLITQPFDLFLSQPES